MHHEIAMREALKEARLALAHKLLPVGCVITNSSGTIISRAHKTTLGRLDHAETNALRQLFGADLETRKHEGLTLYTTLEPCIMCFGMMSHCPVGTLVYALPDPYGGAAVIPKTALPLRHQKRQLVVHAGLLRDEAQALMSEFLATTDQVFWKEGLASDLFRQQTTA